MGIGVFDVVSPWNQGVSLGVGGGGETVHIPDSNIGQAKFVSQLFVANRDSIAHVLRLGVDADRDQVWVAEVTIPVGTGVAGVPPIDLLPLLLPGGVGGVALRAADGVTIICVVGRATGVLTFLAVGGWLV